MYVLGYVLDLGQFPLTFLKLGPAITSLYLKDSMNLVLRSSLASLLAKGFQSISIIVKSGLDRIP